MLDNSERKCAQFVKIVARQINRFNIVLIIGIKKERK